MNTMMTLNEMDHPAYEGTISIVSVDGSIYVCWDGVIDTRHAFDDVDTALMYIDDETA